MKVKHLTIINVIITLVVLLGNVFYQGLGFNYTLKILCSSGFVLMGFFNVVYACKRVENKSVMIFMALGLVLAFLGDVAINLNFIMGAAFFALGHVLFVVSYLAYKKMTKLDVIFSAVLGLFSIIFVLTFPYIMFEVAFMQYVVLAYAVIISVMVGKALGNVVRDKSAFTGMIAVASVLFYISDLMLLLAYFSSITGWTSNACMGTYYPGLCMLAGSMIMYIKKNVKEVA